MRKLFLIAALMFVLSASTASACLFCGMSQAINVTNIWWNPPVAVNVGKTDCDNHGGVKDAFTREVRENGIDYLTIGVECNDGTIFIYEKIMIGAAQNYGILAIFAYQDPTPEPPSSNWWDGWNGDCNNPPVDPTGQEVWSWC